jgi:hypothetical protein
MVCRRPTDADLRERAPIVVTERDKELLVDVYRHGFLTTDLIELAYFPPDAQRRSRSSCCYDRLKLLWLWNYVDRIELPVARVLGGRRPYLYTLGRRGLPYVQERISGTLVQLRRLDRLHDLFIEHDLRSASLWASLKAVVRATRLRWVRWTSERELRARLFRVEDPDTGRWLPVLPDGLFALGYPDGTTQAALVEVDMGTVDLKRFRRKVRAIERFYQLDGFWQHLKLEHVEVWVLAKSAERIEHLRDAAWPEVPEERREDYLFATFDEVTPDHVAGTNWLYLDGKRRAALYPDAFGEAGDPEAPK